MNPETKDKKFLRSMDKAKHKKHKRKNKSKEIFMK